MKRAAILASVFLAAYAQAGTRVDFDSRGPAVKNLLKTLTRDAERPASPEAKQVLSSVDIDESSIEITEVKPAFSAKGEPQITLPVEPPSGKPETTKPLPPVPTIPSIPDPKSIDPEKIINIGERIWKFIENNKPKIETQNFYANAVPTGITHWAQLEGWSQPESTLYSFTAKNKNGQKVVDVTYIILRTPQGKMKGMGKYLTGVTALPVKVDVTWGYRFSMAVDVPSVSNVGTSEAPLAGMTLNLAWTIENNFKMSKGAGIYYLQGDGLFKQLAAPDAVKEVN